MLIEAEIFAAQTVSWRNGSGDEVHRTFITFVGDEEREPD
jgi:hypothetical protein